MDGKYKLTVKCVIIAGLCCYFSSRAQHSLIGVEAETKVKVSCSNVLWPSSRDRSARELASASSFVKDVSRRRWRPHWAFESCGSPVDWESVFRWSYFSADVGTSHFTAVSGFTISSCLHLGLCFLRKNENWIVEKNNYSFICLVCHCKLEVTTLKLFA